MEKIKSGAIPYHHYFKDPIMLMGIVFTSVGLLSLFSSSSPPPAPIRNQNLTLALAPPALTNPQVGQTASTLTASTQTSSAQAQPSSVPPHLDNVWIIDEKGGAGSDGKKIEDILSKIKADDEIKFRPGKYFFKFNPKFPILFSSESQKSDDVELIQMDNQPLAQWDSVKLSFENLTIRSTRSIQDSLKSPIFSLSNNAEISLKNVHFFINEKTAPHFINSKVFFEQVKIEADTQAEIYFEDSKFISQFSAYNHIDFSFSFKSVATFQSDQFKNLKLISLFETSGVRFFKTKLSEEDEDLVGNKFNLDQTSTLLWDGKKITDLNNYRANLSFSKKPGSH